MILFVGFACATLFALHAGPTCPGLFAESTDIGTAAHGLTAFDAAASTWKLTGGGSDMWGTTDAFHFAWRRITDDASLTATIHFAPGFHAPLEKAVLMFRQSLDPDSKYVDVALHADGHITLQYRDVQGGITDDITAPHHGATTLRIQRQGDRYIGYAALPDGKLVEFASAVVALRDPVAVGLGVCAHDPNRVISATFSSVHLRHLDITPADSPPAP